MNQPHIPYRQTVHRLFSSRELIEGIGVAQSQQIQQRTTVRGIFCQPPTLRCWHFLEKQFDALVELMRDGGGAR